VTTVTGRPRACGKFVFVDDEKLYVRGVTYGTFPFRNGSPLPAAAEVRRDFELMKASGVNALRTYTVPPGWLLDLAQEHDLHLLVGLPWEQHVAFLDDRSRPRSIEAGVREGVRACAGHPAVLAYAVGNEIPASIVRWHGRRRVERFLERLYRAAKREDPDGLVTYVNYPSTEYLHLPFVDLLCFNVFLEAEEKLEAYLGRLQQLAGDRPLLITELGLDSGRHGEDVQATVLDWQVRTAFRSGSAGTFVFSWTDEWERGGLAVEDWAFGLTDRKRRPKPALEALGEAFAEVPLKGDVAWPRISVVVCSHNGARTIGDCLDGIARLDYPDYETIVVDDGSTDDTANIVQPFGLRLIRTEHRGLSSARNAGLEAASGEIVAYLDDDARPDPHWLRYLAATFMTTRHVGVGGPNVPPEGSSILDACMAEAPGGPIHVLFSDREAEHIPGCNMAFRKKALEDVGGFDPQFWTAGDDVDMCWRLRDREDTLGFSPAAMVWHRRRPSVSSYLRQQRGYGAAEALLERKWPERYNRGGHLRWSGNVYAGRVRRAIGLHRWRVYYGTWGSGLFQSVYERAPGTLAWLPLMPEWYLLVAVLAVAAAYELSYKPLFFEVPWLGVPLFLLLFCLSLWAVLGKAVASAWSVLPRAHGSRSYRVGFLLTMTALCALQPAARLGGRLRQGLTPWRTRGLRGIALPRPQRCSVWSERWRAPTDWLRRLEAEARRSNVAVYRGGDYDRWDLEARVGALGSARLRMAVEEHGHGKQLLRFRLWPVWSRLFALLVPVLALWLAFELVRDTVAAAVVGLLAVLVIVRALREGNTAVGLLLSRIELISEDVAAQADGKALTISVRPNGSTRPSLVASGSENGEEATAATEGALTGIVGGGRG
jgi:O-antigen biosynthesis protein